MTLVYYTPHCQVAIQFLISKTEVLSRKLVSLERKSISDGKADFLQKFYHLARVHLVSVFGFYVQMD